VEGGIKEQTRQVMENLKAILTERKRVSPKVVKTTVFLQDIKTFADFKSGLWGVFSGEPAGSKHIPGGCAAAGAMVEIEMIVLLG